MKISSNGVDLFIHTGGEGRPVLLIHGYPLDGTIWEPQITGLGETARIIAPDLRGHGASAPAPGPYSMDLLAEDCANVLEALEISEPVVVGGLSMGGYIALAFYRNFPKQVAGLVLAATRAGADSPEGKAGRDAAAKLAQDMGADAIAASMLPKMLAPSTYETQPALVAKVQKMMAATSVEGIIGDLAAMKNRPDSTPLLPEISVPTLIIHGAEDQILPRSEAEVMYKAIPDAQMKILANAGHLISLEQPALFNNALQDFLTSLG
jgi:pimeloyl-ACP methyl ester carboxylesterase